MMDIKEILLQWFINSLIKNLDQKSCGSGIKNDNISNKELAEELHKPILENLRKEKRTHLL